MLQVEMVGKVKQPRQKLHSAAVRLKEPACGKEPPRSWAFSWAWASEELLGGTPFSAGEGAANCSLQEDCGGLSSVFAETKIDPRALVQTLDQEDTRSGISAKKGLGEKLILSKKEKRELRRERWLNKIEAIRLGKQKQKAEAKRKATPVVGDMQPLADALPELSQLFTASRPPAPRKQAKNNVVKKPEPTDYSQMKAAQKRKLVEEEVFRFRQAIVNPAFKANPLAEIEECLRKRLKQEEESPN
ncbi:protein FAM207A [Latimeria chalumnae]|uniref:SLX9 ribosome biosis factor n=1 Tax=Latimeria chalumnae TaxID=7897 RepID=H3B6W8_LATCH|nr:PREDICTED: protein FAM207A [Latimeria chalumnae]|eukprot:XP_005997000.1 PREDICTED: protein FAM207A [Latimeria chalumnae]